MAIPLEAMTVGAQLERGRGASRFWIRIAANCLVVAFAALLFARCLFVIRDSIDSSACAIRCGFVGPQYYLSYEHGFVRRGLPGAIIELLGGPSSVSVDALGWRLTFAAVIAVAALAVMMFVQLRGSVLRYAASALVILSPLSVSLFVTDPGRYDTIGVVAFLAIAVLGFWSPDRRRPVLVGTATTLAMVIAALCEELLVLFMIVPVLVLMSRHIDRSRGARTAVLITAVPIVIGAGVAFASTLRRPTQAYVDAIQIASGRPPNAWSAALFLRDTLSSEARFVADHGLQQLLHTALIWLFVFILAALVFALAYRVHERWYWYVTAVNALAPLVFSIVALDQRRWWTLAFIAQTTAVIVKHGGSTRDGPEPEGGRASHSDSTNLLIFSALSVLIFGLVPEMFLVDPGNPRRFYVFSIAGLSLATLAIVGYAKRWWVIHPTPRSPMPARVRDVLTLGDSTTLLFVAPLVLLLAIVFVTTSWILIPLDFWQESGTWSSIWSYWLSWSRG